MHMMENFLKNINTKSDEKVYIVSCRVKQFSVLISNIFPVIEGVSRELAYICQYMYVLNF